MEKQQLKAPPTQVATGVIIVHNAIPMLAIICISYNSLKKCFFEASVESNKTTTFQLVPPVLCLIMIIINNNVGVES